MIAWPWAARRRAARQLAALDRWRSSGTSSLVMLYRTADGYYLARDWIGVESCYLAAREHVDTDKARVFLPCSSAPTRSPTERRPEDSPEIIYETLKFAATGGHHVRLGVVDVSGHEPFTTLEGYPVLHDAGERKTVRVSHVRCGLLGEAYEGRRVVSVKVLWRSKDV